MCDPMQVFLAVLSEWHQVTSSDIKWHQKFLCKTKWEMVRELQHICVTNLVWVGPMSVRSIGQGGPEACHVLHHLAHHTVARLAEDPGRELGSDCHGYVTAMSLSTEKHWAHVRRLWRTLRGSTDSVITEVKEPHWLRSTPVGWWL